MNREYLDYLTKDMEENSVKKACYYVREYLRYADVTENGIVQNHPKRCAVTNDEFIKSLNIILGHSYNTSNDDTILNNMGYCEADCKHNSGNQSFCKGEFTLSKSKKLCKYYNEEDK